MPPRTADGPQSGPTATDAAVTGGVDSTGPDTVAAGDPVAPQVNPTREAATTGGAKWIRTLHPGDRYVHDRKANDDDPNKGVVTGRYQEFSATKAKELIAAAQRAGVRLLVADKES